MSEKLDGKVIFQEEVLKELERLGIKKVDTYTKEKCFTLEEEEDKDACIPVEIVQLLWGYKWIGINLEWNKLPGDSDFYEEDQGMDEDFDEEARSVDISYAFYLDGSFSMDDHIYMAIGSCQFLGQLGRISISLSDEDMSNPTIYLDDFESEPYDYGRLSEFLEGLISKDKTEVIEEFNRKQ